MKKIALLLIPLLLMSDSWSKKHELPDTFKLSIGTYIVGDNKTIFSFKDHNGLTASIDMQNILNMETTATSLYGSGYYRFSPHHRIEFGYGGVQSSATQVYGKDYGYIDLTAGVDSHLNISVFKLLYNYSFYHNKEVELGISFGIHRTELDYALSAYLGKNEKEHGFSIVIAPPVPVLGVRVHYNILRAWSISYNLDAMSLSSKINYKKTPNIKGFSGYITDQTIATEYQVIDNISLGLGLNYNKMSVDFKKEKYDIGLENDVLGINAFASVLF